MASERMQNEINDLALAMVNRTISQRCRNRNSDFYGIRGESCAFLYMDFVKELRDTHYPTLSPRDLPQLFGNVTNKGCKRPDPFVKIRNSIEWTSPYICIPISNNYWGDGFDGIAPFRNLTLFEAERCQARARHPQIGFYITTRFEDNIAGVYYEKKGAALSENVAVHDRRSLKGGWTDEKLVELTRLRIRNNGNN